MAAHWGKDLLQPPIGGPERLELLPPLKGRQFRLEGEGFEAPTWDIVLSNLGWAATTIRLVLRVLFFCWGQT